MRRYQLWFTSFFIVVLSFILNGCATQNDMASDDMGSTDQMMSEADRALPLYHNQAPYSSSFSEGKYISLMPPSIDTNKKVVVVDPKLFAWGAYDNGKLVRGGIATVGADYCPDDQSECRTHTGTFHVFSVGGVDCVSRTYPRPQGGALMPYCMFFSQGQSLHGTPDQMMAESNISHGCVHLRIPDAEWLRNNFVNVGTTVIIKPY